MPSRGQIFFASLDPIQGREQSGRRPVLVVSSNAINHQPLVIAVIVGTDAANIRRDYPTNIRVTAAECRCTRTIGQSVMISIGPIPQTRLSAR